MDPILVGKAVTTPDSLPETGGRVFLQPKLANRHGLVAGAPGTGKTVTLMTLAEGFSRIGVPVFMADVKGDVAGLAVPGDIGDRLRERAEMIGVAAYGPPCWRACSSSTTPSRACSTSCSSSPTTAACCC